MEKSKFLEVKTQVDIIEACDEILLIEPDEDGFFFPAIKRRANENLVENITQLLGKSDKVKERFLKWVQTEKEIAEQKLKEI